MAVLEGVTSAQVMGVGLETGVPAHFVPKAIPYDAAGGHYMLNLRINSTAVQAANSRIFEIRNTSASRFIIPTRLRLRALQTAAGTAQENSIDVYKVTGFTAVDTTNTLTPTSSVARTTGMAAFPGTAAAIRFLNPAAAGMTGGTLTKDAQAIGSLPYNVAAAINTTTIWGPEDAIDETALPRHPGVFALNEGLIIENRVLNVTSYGITWYIDFSWADVTAY